jgi:hypothetical protein
MKNNSASKMSQQQEVNEIRGSNITLKSSKDQLPPLQLRKETAAFGLSSQQDKESLFGK